MMNSEGCETYVEWVSCIFAGLVKCIIIYQKKKKMFGISHI